MHSRDGVHIVYARPASFQIQIGGCVIRVCLTGLTTRSDCLHWSVFSACSSLGLLFSAHCDSVCYVVC